MRRPPAPRPTTTTAAAPAPRTDELVDVAPTWADWAGVVFCSAVVGSMLTCALVVPVTAFRLAALATAAAIAVHVHEDVSDMRRGVSPVPLDADEAAERA